MRIFIDIGCLSRGRTTGWERYTSAIVDAFKEDRRGLDIELLAPPRDCSRLAWEQYGLPRTMRKVKGLLHCPASPPSLLVRTPRVITVHDATLFFHPEWGSRAGRYLYRHMLLMERHNRQSWQLTPTQASRADLAIAGFSETRIHVASPPGEEFLNVVEKAPSGIGHKFILFVGTMEPRKNLGLLFDAWTRCTVRDALFVIVGRRAWGTPPAPRDDVVELGAVSDAELLWLYRHAAALVSPSHYEGFGLPVVEARAQGTAVIATDIPASHEVVGDAATYFHPQDATRLSELITDALTKHGDRRDTPWEPPREHGRYSHRTFGDELALAYRAIGEAANL